MRFLLDSNVRRTVLCAIALLGCASPALAWNAHGHRTVAAAAWRKLTPQARIRVMELLKLNPYYPRWVARLPKSVSENERDELIFIQAATWADDIKDRNSGYTDDPRQPDSLVPSDYSDKHRHLYWHYRDVCFSTDGTPLPPDETPNAETEIVRMRAILASATTTDAQKSYALVWLVHLVGDIHQPLHAAARISRDFPKGDLGGNKVQLTGAGSAHTLHAFWDDILGTSSSLRSAAKLADSLPSAGQASKIMDEKQWVQESYRLAREKVYVDPIGDGPGPFQLDEKYKAAAADTARKQAALAGERLANILNNELPPNATAIAQPAPADAPDALYIAVAVTVTAGLLIGWWLVRRRCD